MSYGTKENTDQILSVNLGFVHCHKLLQKSLWWITRDYNNKNLKVVLTCENNHEEILNVLNKYSTRCSWLLVKTTPDYLKSNYNIQSYSQSIRLSYDICNNFCTSKKVISSPQIIFGNNCFKQYVDLIENDSIISMNCFMMPDYVQVGLTESSSNMCEFLAKECRKFPIYNNDYPAKKIDYEVKVFYETELEKTIKFSNFECFYLDNDLNKQNTKQEDIIFDKSKIDNNSIVSWLC